MNLSAPWSLIGPVEVSDAATAIPSDWHVPAYPDSPQRIFDVRGPFTLLIGAALAYFPEPLKARDVMLSRMGPGQVHGMHVDRQTVDRFVTRVHVPLVTNPRCWMLFEEEGERVHFEAGQAYAFDTNRRHAFGNEGETDRVHLIFDVVRR